MFVHGTGVRAEAYEKGFRTVCEGLRQHRPGLDVRRCYWGSDEGVRLTQGGISVPGYGSSGGNTDRLDAETERWAALYTDPYYELRLLGEAPPTSAGAFGGGLPAGDRFAHEVERFQPSDTLLTALDEHGLAQRFRSALEELPGRAEFRALVRTVGEDGYEERGAVARALLARTVLTQEGDALLAGVHRDALLELLGEELRTQGRSLQGRLGRLLSAAVLPLATSRAVHRRGQVTDGVLPAAGDILRYQAHGDGLRRRIRHAIEQAEGDSVTVLAHSLGGVAAVDLLVLEEVPRVTELITVGSQAPFLYEAGALVSLEPSAPLPDHFPRWLNVYDRRDLLSYLAEPLFPSHARDVAVDNRQPFPQAHSTYWSNPVLWEEIHTWMK